MLQSERKYVTVVFADLRGSLELLAHRDPEDAQAVLEPVLEQLVIAVHRHGGTVNQVLGDGIMALFGAPVAYEDHALRACAAALDMQEAIRELAAQLQRERRIGVEIRVGMNSGEVVVRATIADFQKDYSAVGETTHIAARVEQLAAPGTVMLTAQTYRLVEGLVEVAAAGQIETKGLAQPLELYRLVGLLGGPGGVRGVRARALSRFVGRTTELETLRQAIENVRHGRAQLLAVIGEPGVGKSRLFLEFLRTAAVDDMLVLECGAEAYGRTGAFFPLVELLRAYLRLGPGDSAESIDAKVRDKLRELGLAEAAVPALVAVLAPAPRVKTPSTETTAERQYEIVAGVCDVIVAEARRQPVLLVVEDLHWLDTQTQLFLDLLVDRLRDAPIALLVSRRAEHDHTWGRRSYTQVRLERLAGDEVNELLGALIGDDPSLDSLKRELALHTDGNPLFLEETVRALIESQVLAGAPGCYRLVASTPEVRVPASVQAVLAARIDRLSPDEKRVLQCAAVIGRHVPRRLLVDVLDERPEYIERAVAHLRSAEFFYESRRLPSREDVFKHALTHEVAYGSLLHERRRALHERVLQALEHPGSPGGVERIEQLAHHAVRAEAWEPAVRYLRQAATQAVARSADADAVRHLEAALEALSRLPETSDTLAQSIDIRLELRNALLPVGERERIFRSLVEAEAIAARLGDDRRLGWVSGYLTPHLWGIGDYERALGTGRQALAAANRLGDQALEVIANRYLGHVHYSVGDYRAAAELLRKSASSLSDDVVRQHFSLPFMTSVATGSWLVLALAELGEFAEAIERGVQLMAAAEQAGHAYSVATASCGLSLAHLRQGEVELAISTAERALEISRTRDFSGLIGWASSMLGYAYALAGQPDEALLLLEEGTAQTKKTRVTVGESLIAAALGEAYLLAGRHAEASTTAARALQVARARGERGYEAWTLRLLAEVAAAASPPDVSTAEAQFRDAALLAEELGMRPLFAHCYLGLGTLHGRSGRAAEAANELTRAMTTFQGLRMMSWARRAERQVTQAP